MRRGVCCWYLLTLTFKKSGHCLECVTVYNLFVLNEYKGILFSVWSRTSVLKEPHVAPEPQVGDPLPMIW